MSTKDDENARINVISQDKPYGRPLISFKISDLPVFLLPKVQPDDFFVCLDDDVVEDYDEELFREDDILLVRKLQPSEPSPGGAALVGRKQDQLVISRYMPEDVERIGLVIWSSRRLL
jgi:hypothetical protein